MTAQTPLGTGPTQRQEEKRNLWGRGIASLQRLTGLLLVLVVALGTAGALWHLHRESAQLYEGLALQAAELQAQMLTEFRKLYASEVVTRAERSGVKAAHDYADREGAIPLPATLTFEFDERLHRHRPGAHVRLYSDWPFPWRKTQRGELDDFQQQALHALRERPDEPFYRFEEYEGRPSLRYAVADRMQAACLHCHNDPGTGSPRTGWREGDVRGVLEIVHPLDEGVGQAQGDLRRSLVGTVAAFGLGLLGLGVLARRLHRARAHLREERNLLHSLMELVPDSIYFKDRASRFVRISRALAQRLGLTSPNEAVGKTDFDFFTEEHARPAWQDEQEVMRSGQPIVGKEEKETWADGHTRWVSTTKVPLCDRDGQIVGTLGISRDITARKEAEAVLKASEERTRLIVDTAHDAFVAMNAAGEIAEWNRQAETTFGWPRAEALGRSLADTIVPPQHRDAHRRGLAHFLATGEGPVLNRRIEVAAVHRDGHEFPVELTIAPIRLAREYFFAAFVHDITERKRAEEELRRAKEAAEAASLAKSEFLANMSHEIRTPMNGIIGMTQLALDTELTREQRDYLNMVNLSAESLLAVINDILDFSKIEARKLHLETVDFSLRDCLGDTVKALALRAEQKGLEVACHIHPEVPDGLNGDPGRLRQIIVNLVGNAIKFTERGEVIVEVSRIEDRGSRVEDRGSPRCGPVSGPGHCGGPQVSGEARQGDLRSATVAGSGDPATTGSSILDPRSSILDPRSSEALHFSVRDTGIGIPKEKLAVIFEAFAQADTSTTRQYGGTGLGLTISSRLVELMGGRIWVESEVGKGSTFHFTARYGLAQGPVASRGVRQPRDLHGLPVLVVDDNATNRLILKEMLTSWRMQPTTVDSAAAALEALERAARVGEPYPLVLLDAMMPHVDGFTLAEQIQQRPELAGTVLLMLSSAARPEDTSRCRTLGISNYLTKPIKQSELLDAILTARHAAVAASEPSATPALPVPAGQRRLHVLLAEDNLVNQRLAVRLLEKGGHTVVVARNGRDALAVLERERFDLVFMDLQMPDMGGFEATQELRAREWRTGQHLPVIAMTAHAMKGDRERCLEAGMDDYVSKPVRAQELFEAIARVLPDEEVTAPPHPAPEVPLDRADLLDRVGGDLALLREIVGVFLDTFPGMLAELQQAFQRRDPAALHRVAHTLKGMVGNFGARAAVEAALRLEGMGRTQDLDQVGPALAELEQALDRLRPALARLLEEGDEA
jgi:PAS domain S-box-containing protein